jgi:hypothetical protein
VTSRRNRRRRHKQHKARTKRRAWYRRFFAKAGLDPVVKLLQMENTILRDMIYTPEERR